MREGGRGWKRNEYISVTTHTYVYTYTYSRMPLGVYGYVKTVTHMCVATGSSVRGFVAFYWVRLRPVMFLLVMLVMCVDAFIEEQLCKFQNKFLYMDN